LSIVFLAASVIMLDGPFENKGIAVEKVDFKEAWTAATFLTFFSFPRTAY